MDSTQLEKWALLKAAQNKQPHPDWTPVLLYRNGKAGGMGAIHTIGGMPQLLTAAHLFWIGGPAYAWSYRVLQPASSAMVPIIGARAFEINLNADVAICTPGTILHDSQPLPNFYFQGPRWFSQVAVDVVSKGISAKKIVSTLSGERALCVGMMAYLDAPYVILDYGAKPGESGTVFYDEDDPKAIYVLKGFSPELTTYCKKSNLCQSGMISLALKMLLK